jgi:hypothetical protein
MTDKPACCCPVLPLGSNCCNESCWFKTVRSTGFLGVNPNDMSTINVKLCLNTCMF